LVLNPVLDLAILYFLLPIYIAPHWNFPFPVPILVSNSALLKSPSNLSGWSISHQQRQAPPTAGTHSENFEIGVEVYMTLKKLICCI
jgi:hypothetical protein